jgi:hypothetical protein
MVGIVQAARLVRDGSHRSVRSLDFDTCPTATAGGAAEPQLAPSDVAPPAINQGFQICVTAAPTPVARYSQP